MRLKYIGGTTCPALREPPLNEGTGSADFEKEEMGYKFEQDAYGFDIQPDDINYIMNIFSIKTKGYFIDSEGKKNNFPENLIDKYVIPTLPNFE